MMEDLLQIVLEIGGFVFKPQTSLLQLGPFML